MSRSKSKGPKPVAVFDFDGVIHSYTSGWRGANVAWDPPVKGIREVIEQLRLVHGYKVVVLSARSNHPGGIQTIKNYLDQYEIYVDDVVTTKPAAKVTIDDRCICFHPREVSTLLDRIVNFKPWNLGDL